MIFGVTIFTSAFAKTHYPPLFPYPTQVEWQQGQFKLDSQTKIYLSSNIGKHAAQELSSFLQPPTGYLFEQTQSLAQNQVRFQYVQGMENEAYRLHVGENKIVIESSSEEGMFYGVQTLRQLMPKDIESRMPINKVYWSIPQVNISDQPKFTYRGMHLDVSRHFYPVSFVKQYIDWLAFHKFNKFQWHLTDDQGWRIEIKAFPKLTSIGGKRAHTVVGHTYDYKTLFDGKVHQGFYTQEQIRDVIEYANARHIEVIPEIDVPGHSSAILAAYPELSCHKQSVHVEGQFGIFPQVLCPTAETFSFLDKVFAEVSALFPSKLLHIGGDEVIKEQWLESPFVQQLMVKENLTSGDDVQSYFIQQVAKLLNKYDKTLVGWDEILASGAPSDAMITSWQGIEGGINASKRGHKAIMTPYEFTYFDAYQSRSVEEPKAIHGFLPIDKVYGYQVVPDDLTTEQQQLIIGVQGALWTEYIKTARHAEYMVFPRLSALANVAWGNNDNWSRFQQNLPNIIRRYQAMNINASYSFLTPNIRIEEATPTRMLLNITSGLSQSKLNVLAYDAMSDTEQIKSLNIDNNGNVALNEMKTIKVQAQYQDMLSLPLTLTVTPHKAIGKNIIFTNQPSGDSKVKINDGVFAYDQYYDVNQFAVFYGEDMEAIIDFEHNESVSQIIMGVNAGRHRQLVPPDSIAVYYSNDGQQWQQVKYINGVEVEQPVIRLNFDTISARYVKVIAKNKKQSFDKQIPLLPLYIDEIAVF